MDKGQGDISNLKTKTEVEDNDDNSWASSTDSEAAGQKQKELAVAAKWKELYGGSKTPTPEPEELPLVIAQSPSIDSPAVPPPTSTNKPLGATALAEIKASGENIDKSDQFASAQSGLDHDFNQTPLQNFNTVNKHEDTPVFPSEDQKVPDVVKVKNNPNMELTTDVLIERPKIEASTTTTTMIEDEDCNWSDSEVEDYEKDLNVSPIVNNNAMSAPTVSIPEVMKRPESNTKEVEQKSKNKNHQTIQTDWSSSSESDQKPSAIKVGKSPQASEVNQIKKSKSIIGIQSDNYNIFNHDQHQPLILSTRASSLRDPNIKLPESSTSTTSILPTTGNNWATASSDKLPNKSHVDVALKRNSPLKSTSQEKLLDWSSDNEDISEHVRNTPGKQIKSDSADELSNLDVVTSSESLGDFAVSNSTNKSNKTDADSKACSQPSITKNINTLFMVKQPFPITITESSSSLNLNGGESTYSDRLEQNLDKQTKESNPILKPQAVVTALPNPNPKDRRKNTDPIPFSTLLMTNPTEVKKQLAMSTTTTKELSVEKIQDSFTTILSSDSKSVGDLSIQSKGRKPLLNRLKSKWTKMTRSSSSKSSLSAKSSATDNFQIPQPENNDSRETTLPVPNLPKPSKADALNDSLANSEQQNIQLLLAAKTILEKKLIDGGKLNALLELAVKSPRSDAEDSIASADNSSSDQKMKSKSRNDSPNIAYQSECCNETGTAEILSMPLSRYCDAIDPCDPNPEVVSRIIEDMACVTQKLLGNNRNYKNDCVEFECEVLRLRQELECCIECKNCLEGQLADLTQELQGMQMVLEDETQQRVDLEDVTTTIREQLGRSDDTLCAELQEKIRMEECIRELQAQLLDCCASLETLEMEKQELLRNCHSHQEDIQTKENDCCGLQEALAKCCAEVDCLQMCIEHLKTEVNRLNRENKDLQCELDSIMCNLECEKSKVFSEKSCLEENVTSLKEQLDLITKEKNEACRKFNEIVRLHHEELDSLKSDADRFQCLYEEEKKAREDLEKRLRDCEDQKALRLQQQIQHQDVQQTEHNSQITQLRNDCESYRLNIQSLHQERASLQSAKQCVEQQLETIGAEKVQLQTQLQELQDTSNKATVVKNDISDNQKQLEEKLQKYEIEKADIENQNEILQLQLQKTLSEKTAFRYENDHLNEKVQNAETEKYTAKKENEELLEKLQIAEVSREQSEKNKQKLEERLCWTETIKATLEDERTQLLLELEKKEAEKARVEMLHYSNQQIETTKVEELPNKSSISDQYVNRNEAYNLKADYESKLEQLKTRLKLEAEAHFRQKLEKVEMRLEKQYKNQPAPEDPNENKMFTDLTAINKSLKHDAKKLKKMVKERDDHIIALQDVINEIKKRYSEQHKELRMQKIKMQALQTDLTRLEAQSNKESEELTRENIRISRERKNVEKEKLKLQEEIRITEKEKVTLENLTKMKDRIESEVTRLKMAISQQLIDRSELEKVQSEYEAKLFEVKNQFDAQLEMNRQLAEINEYLGKQSQDRALVDKIRDSNENLLRKELNSVSISLRLDTEKLKKLITERDEEINSLRKAVCVLKSKYATEAQNREELMKKVKILSTISQESLEISNSNNNIVSRGLQTME